MMIIFLPSRLEHTRMCSWEFWPLAANCFQRDRLYKIQIVCAKWNAYRNRKQIHTHMYWVQDTTYWKVRLLWPPTWSLPHLISAGSFSLMARGTSSILICATTSQEMRVCRKFCHKCIPVSCARSGGPRGRTACPYLFHIRLNWIIFMALSLRPG